MRTKNKQMVSVFIALFVCGVMVFFDQYTKQLAINYLEGQAPIVLFKDIFELHYTINKGAAFGILQNKQIFFSLLTLIVLIGLSIVYLRIPVKKRFWLLKGCIIVLIAGALGNFIDRIRLNYVVDFFYFKLIDFPIFNVADIYVTCSAFLLVASLFFVYQEEELTAIFEKKKREEDLSSKK